MFSLALGPDFHGSGPPWELKHIGFTKAKQWLLKNHLIAFRPLPSSNMTQFCLPNSLQNLSKSNFGTWLKTYWFSSPGKLAKWAPTWPQMDPKGVKASPNELAWSFVWITRAPWEQWNYMKHSIRIDLRPAWKHLQNTTKWLSVLLWKLAYLSKTLICEFHDFLKNTQNTPRPVGIDKKQTSPEINNNCPKTHKQTTLNQTDP